MQLLAIKIGNSNIGYGLFDEERLVQSWRVETRPDKTADEYASELRDLFEAANGLTANVTGVAIGSVVPALTATFQQVSTSWLRRRAFVVEPGIETGMELVYEDPRALGTDRLVAMVAARAHYGVPALVVDFGTATTFNALDASGRFVGGAIAPGLSMEAEALHHYTAKLPLVEISPPPRALAQNTRDALRSGIFLGYAGLVEGLVLRLRQEMQEPAAHVIATGGFAALIAPYCPSVQIVDPLLGLEGLRLLYRMNVKRIREAG